MSLSHKKLASWYLQLAQSLESGVSLPAALDTCLGAPAHGRRLMSSNLQAGMDVDDMLKQAPSWLPKKDRYFWSAAAQSGRLPQTLRTLGDQHTRMGAAKMKLILGGLYPVGMLTFAGLIIPVMLGIDFEKGVSSLSDVINAEYFMRVAIIEGSLWGSLAILAILAKLDSPILPLLAKFLPGFSGHAKNQALADFSYALAAFLEAGTPIGKAWAASGLVTHQSKFKRAGVAMRKLIDDGATPSEHLHKHRCFPQDFRSLYTTGEKTGQLEKNLVVLGQQYQQGANNAMTFASIFYPAIMFMVIAGIIVYAIVTFYAGYLKGMTGFMEQ
ncbi:type II secretion system F family protein [Cerasicoccus maritimus]|uniref:type II secretion system F family protein n=1 Tax=Cerasicoccus maritimus TaxID=490089 RepID=UPI002852A738|nr:type II secretion system F family protein [Cerasicoccus maritimus]